MNSSLITDEVNTKNESLVDITFKLFTRPELSANEFPAFFFAKRIETKCGLPYFFEPKNIQYPNCNCDISPSIGVRNVKTWNLLFYMCPKCGDYYEPNLHK